MNSLFHDRGIITRYREYLPVTDATPVISLNEGSTPLIYSPRLSALVGRGCEVYVKYEGLNPTGSFKDRGMTVAISKAVEAGSEAGWRREVSASKDGLALLSQVGPGGRGRRGAAQRRIKAKGLSMRSEIR